MPKKRNFLGGMQNYNAKTGEYESALVGGNGKPVEDADGDGKKHESRSGGSLNIPVKKVTQKQLNKEVTDMFKTREEAEKWLSEQKDMSKEDIAHAKERFDKAFSKESKIPYDQIDGDYERSWGPVNFDSETNPDNLINFINKNIGNDDIVDSLNNATDRLTELVKFSDEELDTLMGGTGEEIEELLNSKKSKGFKSFGKKEELTEESIKKQLTEIHAKLDPLVKENDRAFIQHLRTGEPYQEKNKEEINKLSQQSKELRDKRDLLRKNKAIENAKKLGRKDYSKELENFYSEESGFKKLDGEDRIYALQQYLETNPYLDPNKVLQNDILNNRSKYPNEFEFEDTKYVISKSGGSYDWFKKRDGKWEHIAVGTIYGLGDDLNEKLKTENLVKGK